jgi:hypothetical protein
MILKFSWAYLNLLEYLIFASSSTKSNRISLLGIGSLNGAFNRVSEGRVQPLIPEKFG